MLLYLGEYYMAYLFRGNPVFPSFRMCFTCLSSLSKFKTGGFTEEKYLHYQYNAFVIVRIFRLSPRFFFLFHFISSKACSLQIFLLSKKYSGSHFFLSFIFSWHGYATIGKEFKYKYTSIHTKHNIST